MYRYNYESDRNSLLKTRLSHSNAVNSMCTTQNNCVRATPVCCSVFGTRIELNDLSAFVLVRYYASLLMIRSQRTSKLSA